MSYDERITTYFGDAVLRAGFMPVPHLLMRHYRALDLLSEHAMFAMQLMEISWDLAQPPVTMRKIADRMGISVRTAQRYSEYLAARGLIVIYEQFEDGAQVENGYDLAPLFRALAAFAPEPRPGGTPRERRQRSGALAQSASSPPATTAVVHPHPAAAGSRAAPTTNREIPHDTGDIPPGDSNVIPPGDIPDTGGGDTAITPPRDRADTPRPTPLTGLKGVQESPKKQQEQAGAAVDSGRKKARSTTSGRSLRLERELSAAEVARSELLLDRSGLHAPVARACAATLAPAEVLALAAYARAAGLGTGWIAAQVYDFERRAPRAADIARRWDEAGSRLAALDDDNALLLLELVDSCSPHDPPAVANHPRLAADPPTQLAAAAVWSLMHDVRGGGAATRTLSATAERGAAVAESGPLWSAVLERLRGEIAVAEYETWLRPARLLVLDDDMAIVGTDNIFAREHLQQAHGESLARAFAAVRGRATRVDVVIG